MQDHHDDQGTTAREKAIYRYVEALDQGDADTVAAVLDLALNDLELDQAIAEVNLAIQEEEQLAPLAADAEIVRDLIRTHLRSTRESGEAEDQPLTVGEVAAQLKAERRVPFPDEGANNYLLTNSRPLPAQLSAQTIKRLATDLGVRASDRFWRVFRDTAIMLGMGRSQQAQLLAAREERGSHNRRGGRGEPAQSSKTGAEPEE